MNTVRTKKVHVRKRAGTDSIEAANTQLTLLMSILLAGIYAIRSFRLFSWDDGISESFALSAAGSCLLLGICALSRKLSRGDFLSSALTLLILGLEIRLVWIGHTSFSEFFFLVPLFIIFASLVAGMWAGFLLGGFGIALGLIAVRLRGEDDLSRIAINFDSFMNQFFIYLVISQVLMALMAHIYQKNLEKGLDQIKQHRLKRARSGRKMVLSETIGKAAHEINNPLAILDGALHRLTALGPEANPEIRTRYCDYMRESQRRLENVLESIKVFSASESNEVKVEIPISDIVTQFRKQMEETFRSFGVRFTIQNRAKSDQVLTRPHQLLFVLKVLVDNAIEASEDDTRDVRLTLSSSLGGLRFEVGNLAEGFSTDIGDRLFTPFFTTKPIGQSLGMNLSVARVLIEDMKGTMGYQREGDETVFWFELPR